MSAERSPDTLQPHGQQPNLASPQCPPDGVGGGQTIPLAAALRFIGLGFLLGAILAGALMWLLRRPEPPPIVLHPPPTAAPTPTPLPTATPGPLLVFVSGGVRNPGMYELAVGARVGDALAKAGGLLADADPALVNQAQMVFDGAQIHVPLPPSPTEADASTTPRSHSEAVAHPTLPSVPQPSPGLSGEAPPTDGTRSGPSNTPADGLINVNTATAEELTALPGIGPSKAAAIIADRPYHSVEDLERVPGIGARTIETLAPLVKVRE